MIIAYPTDGSTGVSTSSTGGTITNDGVNQIHTFTSSGTFTLVLAPPPAITSANNSTFTVGTAGTFTVKTSGLPTSAITRSGVNLPTGVGFIDNGDGTGTLSGTPGAGTGGTYALTFTASNGVGANAVQNFTLTINQAPAITSTNNAGFSVGTAASFSVIATAFPTPAITLNAAAMPSGIIFTDNGNGTGTLGGTAAVGTVGTYSLTFTASNGIGTNAVQNFTLKVNQAPAITSANNIAFTYGTAGTFNITTSGLPAPSISTSSTLPTGVTLTDNQNGTATLASTAASPAGVYPISIAASNGANPAAQTFTLTIKPAIATVTLGKLIQAYDGSLKAVSITTNPPNLSVNVTYNGSSTVPSNPASYAVLVTINDPNYVGTTNGTLIIDRTTITSIAAAIPNPVVVLQPVSLSAAATNSNNDPLTYTWNFGDGLQGTGASTAHAYTAPGVYHATVSIDNGLAPITSNVDVTVTAAVALIGEGPDSDGDGFSDSFEALAGTNPASAASTPIGQPATVSNIGILRMPRAQFKLNFAKPGNDSISFSGTLSVPQGFAPTGAVVLIDAGGVLKNVLLGSKGSAKVGNDSFKLTIKVKNGVVQANPAAPFTATFSKGSFATALAATSQLTNGNFTSATRIVTFALVVNGTALKNRQNMLYTATQNKTGSAK